MPTPAKRDIGLVGRARNGGALVVHEVEVARDEERTVFPHLDRDARGRVRLRWGWHAGRRSRDRHAGRVRDARMIGTNEILRWQRPRCNPPERLSDEEKIRCPRDDRTSEADGSRWVRARRPRQRPHGVTRCPSWPAYTRIEAIRAPWAGAWSPPGRAHECAARR